MTNANDTKFEELLRTHTAFDSADALITSMTEDDYIPTLRVPKLTARSSKAVQAQHDAMVFMRSYLTERGLEVFPPEDHVKAQETKVAREKRERAESITVLEHCYLDAIAHSEFTMFNGAVEGAEDIRELVGNEVWSFDPAERFGKSAGGIASSLVKKGLVDACDGGNRMEDTIALTEAGAEALIAANLRFGCAWARDARAPRWVETAPAPEAQPEPQPEPQKRKGAHPRHPKCGCCGKAVYKSAEKGKPVKKSDPWGYCRNFGKCVQAGRFVPVIGETTGVLAA